MVFTLASCKVFARSPGFLAFTVVFVLAFIREQRFMLISLAMLTVGTAITGLFPSLTGLLLTIPDVDRLSQFSDVAKR